MIRDSFISTITNSFIPYQLPRNWKWFFWHDLMKLYQQGLIRSNNQLGSGNVKYLKMGDIDVKGFADLSNLAETNANDKEIKTYSLRKGDFLINVRNTKELVGKTCIINNTNDQIILFNHMLVRINHGNESLNYFLNAFLNIASSKKLLNGIKEGTTTVVALYQRELNKIPIPLPDDKTLNGIVNFYKSIISKIELNNKINTELETMAKTLYDYWFVQFDFPDENGKPYKSSGGEMVWSEELKREIPKGWEVDMINTKVKIGSGFPFDSDDYCDDGKYKIITIKNVQDGSLDTSTIDKIDFIPEKINDFCILKVGDVLMSLTGNVGRMCFVDQENLLLNQRVGKLIGEKDFVIYTYLFFQRPENQARLDKIAGGSSQSNLSPIDAVKDLFVIPPKSILDNFSKIITPIFDQMVKNKQENQKLAELRDFLLPMLMNGQVVVE